MNKVRFLPSQVLCTLYHTMVAPYILYAITTWYGCPNYNRNRIQVLQSKCIRIIKNLDRRTNTTSDRRSLGILSVGDIYFHQIGLFMYNIIINSPNSEFSYIVSQSVPTHTHDTRNAGALRPPRIDRTRCRHSIEYVGINVWNLIPDAIKHANSTNVFKSQLKKHLLNP